MCVPTALPVSLAILMLRSLDKQMPRGYTDHREMIRMNENEMLLTILNELKSMNHRLDSLESGQKDMTHRLDSLESGQKDMRTEMKDMRAEMKDMRADIEDLKEGQKAIRRDVARVDRKLDRLSADVGDTLVYVTEDVDTEINQIRKAK